MAAFARTAAAAVVVAGLLLLAGAPAAAAAVTPRPYTPVGTKINGGDSAADGPILRPGQYVDSLPHGSKTTGLDGSTKYYTVNLRSGETPYVSATLIPGAARAESATLEVTVVISDLEQSSQCSFDAYSSDFSSSERVAELSAAASTPTLGGKDWPEDCPDRGSFAVRITRTGTAFTSAAMKMEIGLHIEPPATTAGLPAAGAPQAYVQPRVDGVTRRLAGGRTFDDAPVVTSGRYRDTIVAGETHYLRVHLDWGQRLSYLITSGTVAGRDYSDSADADADLANPVRQNLDQAEGSLGSAYSFGGDDKSMYGSTLVPVRYMNRSSDDDDIRRYAIDGDYFVIVSTDYVPKGATPFRIPYTIALEVIGTAEPGPTYQLGAIGPSASPATTQASGSDSKATLVAVGAGAVVLVGALVLALVLRRRRPAHAPGAAPTTMVPGPGTRPYAAPYPPQRAGPPPVNRPPPDVRR